MSNYATIKKYNIANGPGVRVAVFFSGCRHYCKGCFNQELWDCNYGSTYTEETQKEILDSINEHIAGLSILGGEPLLEENQDAVLNLCKEFKTRYPHKTIWLWTGFTLEDLDQKQLNILHYVDVLIDGKFEQDKYDYDLEWRGSSNQRILKKNIDF